MAWAEFNYSTISTQGDLGYRPYLEVWINRSDGKKIGLFAIIDSGAETTMISLDIAHFLGIDLNKCKKIRVGGVGGDNSIGYETEIAITFKDFPKTNFTTPVIFSKIPADMLLGQDNFFKNFKVLFDGNEQKFSLNPIPRSKQ